ncbi:hypothetical protein GCM10022291_29580 [Postechiella marina]|uniref:DUF2071 domain-containing protein n=1 Tax=Postechiella marina TaxID=943941 RepID=A0ABP8CF70_9FLAO
MATSNIFMTGNWKNLIMSTYQVNSKILEPYLPKDTEIDLYKGKALISMVAFTFSKVRFFGIPVPFHQEFGQINFRFYVKSKIDGSKGVVFIKEFAPKPLIAWVGNLIYNEPYHYKKIYFNITKKSNNATIRYTHKTIKIVAKNTLKTQKLKPESINHFVVDRYIAFIKNSKKKTVKYTINHKPWLLIQTKTITVNNKILDLLPSKFKEAKHITSCFVDGSYVTVAKGVLQPTFLKQKSLVVTT